MALQGVARLRWANGSTGKEGDDRLAVEHCIYDWFDWACENEQVSPGAEIEVPGSRTGSLKCR